MRRSTTSAGTEPGTASVSRRLILAAVLLAELGVGAAVLVQSPRPAPDTVPGAAPTTAAAPPTSGTAADPVTRRTLPDGRTAQLIALGPDRTLLDRLGDELPGAAAAVTEFWGPDWPRDIVIVAAASDDQFRVLAGGGGDIAATTTAERITFAPGAVRMSPAALRIVLRHELFHYAARSATAADAPRWLTEGVADYVGRGPAARPGPQRSAPPARLPTDADLDTPGQVRSLAYDRAWWFSRYVADRYGAGTLRALYLRACGPGHPDVAGAVRDVLGSDLDRVVADWRRWLAG
ncbi:peptidase [Mycobacterium sp. NPDC003449]